jgi:hypothetical protein
MPLTGKKHAVTLSSMSEAAKVLCPNEREASMLLDEAESHAALGEFFSAGCWYREAVSAADRIADFYTQHAVRSRAGVVCEKIVALERQAMVRAQGRPLPSVRCGCPEGSAELRVGLSHAGRDYDSDVLPQLPGATGDGRTQASAWRRVRAT